MNTKQFCEYVTNELFKSVEGLKVKAMFGGYSFYLDGIIFAMIADGNLYFKVDETNKEDYVKLGSKPFTYTIEGRKPVSMSYWEVPEKIQKDHKKLMEFMQKSVEIGLKKKLKKK